MRVYLDSSAPVASFARAHALKAAQVAAQLRKGQTIGFADCQIAGLVLEEGADLVTHNPDHFTRVQGLRIIKV
jgi:predicted nucleic acid-binding protein